MGRNSRTKIYWKQSPTSLMTLWLYIASALTFTLGNVFWIYLGSPIYYYVPLSILLLMGIICVIKRPEIKTVRQYIFTDWILLLAAGNVIKQIFYNSADVKQWNDIYWGIFLAVFFTVFLIWPKLYLNLFKHRFTKWGTGKPSNRH